MIYSGYIYLGRNWFGLGWGKEYNSTFLHLGSSDFMPLNCLLFHLFLLLFFPQFPCRSRFFSASFLALSLFIFNFEIGLGCICHISLWNEFIDIVRVRLSISFDRTIHLSANRTFLLTSFLYSFPFLPLIQPQNHIKCEWQWLCFV